jgi:hypothetical protein
MATVGGLVEINLVMPFRRAIRSAELSPQILDLGSNKLRGANFPILKQMACGFAPDDPIGEREHSEVAPRPAQLCVSLQEGISVFPVEIIPYPWADMNFKLFLNIYDTGKCII